MWYFTFIWPSASRNDLSITTPIFAIAKFNHVFRLEVSSLLCRGVNAVIVLVLLGPLQYLSRGKHCVEYRTRHVKSGGDEKHSLPLALRSLQVTIKCRFKLKRYTIPSNVYRYLDKFQLVSVTTGPTNSVKLAATHGAKNPAAAAAVLQRPDIVPAYFWCDVHDIWPEATVGNARHGNSKCQKDDSQRRMVAVQKNLTAARRWLLPQILWIRIKV